MSFPSHFELQTAIGSTLKRMPFRDTAVLTAPAGFRRQAWDNVTSVRDDTIEGVGALSDALISAVFV